MDEAVRRVQAGETEAFREVVEGHHVKVRSFIASFGIPAADGDDIAQDVFIHAYEHIREFDPETRIEAWLLTIARYKVLAHLKVVKREAAKRGNAVQSLLQEKAQLSGESGNDENVRRLRLCVERLQIKAGLALRKRYTGVPLADIAREMAMTVDAVKMLLLRIRRQLRKCVEVSP